MICAQNCTHTHPLLSLYFKLPELSVTFNIALDLKVTLSLSLILLIYQSP